MFRPKMISGFPKAEKNIIKLLWYDVTGAKAYNVQIAEDENFENIVLEKTVEGLSFTSPKMPYATHFYVRLKTIAADEMHNSIWNTAEVTTEDRDVTPVLHDVDDSDIFETSAIIRWDVNVDYPADFLTLKSASDTKEITLSEDDFNKGFISVTDLLPVTEYKVTLYNNKIEDEYERPYNTVSFKTAGPPEGAKVITAGDNLSAILMADQNDATITDGQMYYLRGGSYDIEGFALNKGFKIVGAVGSGASVNITIPFMPVGNTSVISFSNVNLTGSDRLIDNGEDDDMDYEFAGIEVNKCNVSQFPSGFIRLQTSKGNVKRIKKIVINNCVFNGMQGGRLIETNNFSDQSAISAELEYVDIKNSTFMNSTKMLLLFLPDAYGYSGSNIQFHMSNVTVFEALCYPKQRMIQMNRLPKTSTVKISNCLLSNEANAHDDTYMFYETCLCGSATTSYTDNYLTGSRLETGRKGISGIVTNLAQNQVFEDYASGNLTLKNNTILYQKKIGDPRWIK